MFLGLKAKIICFTKISDHYICLVQLSFQKKIMLEVTNETKDLAIGDKGILVLRKIGKFKKEDPIIYGLKFKKII